MQKNKKRIAFLAFAMYFITGASCIVVGSSLPHLVKMYEMSLEKVVLLGSSYALGRVATVYLTGKMVEKVGPIKVLGIGTIFLALFLFGIPTFPNYQAGLCFAFIGGMGMGAQDTVCPVLLSKVFHKNYDGALSAGQAVFGIGTFSTPFIIGILLSGKLSFSYSYYILLVIPIIMLCIVPVVKIDREKSNTVEEHVRPLVAKHKLFSYGAILLASATYSASLNTMGMYTSSFAQEMGASESASAFLLTVYNIGCVIGSFTFAIVLQKIKSQTVLLVNNICAFVAVAVALILNSVPVYFLCLFISGFFLGVLFSVIIAIATRIDYQHISVASSLVATSGGLSDFLTPVVTGALISRWGIQVSYKYALLMMALTALAGFILIVDTKDKQEEAK